MSELEDDALMSAAAGIAAAMISPMRLAEDGTLDETMTVQDHDVVLVPRGHHPCGVPWGYEMYYLNVMAGPMRKWRFKNHPDHDWIAQRDA